MVYRSASEWPARLRPAVVAVALAAAAAASAREGEPPRSRLLDAGAAAAVPVVELPRVDAGTLLAEDAAALRAETGPAPGPLRYAVAVDVRITPETHGVWETLAGGGRLWRLRFESPGATDLNFGFTRFRLPPGASLHVVSEALDAYEGPYTAADNEDHGQLWTPPLDGGRAVVELYTPPGAEAPPEIELTRVGTGYRGLFDPARPQVKQGSCNVDVLCPEGDPWRDQIRSVAAYSLGGTIFCTGQMVMDAEGSFRPFFLSANHCGLNAGNAPSMVVFWNFESPVCGQLDGGSLADNQTGATFRAARSGVDFALLELDDPPDPAFGVFWSGWDRAGTAALGSVGIHHPDGEEKAISLNDDLLTSGSSCVEGTPGTHWYVDGWEQGTTEPGSSGSGLWDPASGRLIGFLTGGVGSCEAPGFDCYGKFSVAWDGDSASTRLRDWLDPGGTGVTSVDGSFAVPTVRYDSHLGVDRCASDADGEDGDWEPGETVELRVSLRATGSFTEVQGTLASSSPGVTVVDASASWPDLEAGAATPSEAPHFTIRLDESAACFSQVDFDLEVSTAEGGPFALAFSHPVGAAPPAPDVPRPIPDAGFFGAGVVTSDLAVAADVVLTDVDVRVEIDHTSVGDLHLSLRSPQGTEVVLLDQPGFPAALFGCTDNDMDVVFDDAESLDPESHCAGTEPWLDGRAAPAGTLAEFAGEPSPGTWTLTATDNFPADVGAILDWELLTTPAVGGECGVCTVSPIFGDGFESGDADAWSVSRPGPPVLRERSALIFSRPVFQATAEACDAACSRIGKFPEHRPE